MVVNICGIPHEVIRASDNFDLDAHFGLINYLKAQIVINEKLKGENAKETLCHEMVHGILVHLGYNDLSNDEVFVQSLGNAICQGFEIKEIKNEETVISAKSNICDNYCKYSGNKENEGLTEELCAVCPINDL